MAIELSAGLEEQLERLIEDGEFPGASSAIADAIRAWREESAYLDRWFERLGPDGRGALAHSLEWSAAGPTHEVTAEHFASLRRLANEAARRRTG